MVIVEVVIGSVDASGVGTFPGTSECCCLAFLIADAATPPLTLTTLLVGNLFLPDRLYMAHDLKLKSGS